ncbi:MAG: hypothetical protein DHS20C18_00890 [Saprospiraceae bacterium]|nr:MAG: hypothetical protein DHS20C18_00890 [Saprospiraceae bacterium]
MNRFYLFLFLLLCGNFVYSQNLEVVDITPDANTIATDFDMDISINFNVTPDQESINSNSIKVFGRWSGPMAGELLVLPNANQVRFHPTQPFSAGEQVTVTLAKTIRGLDGETMEFGYSHQFWAKTNPGSLVQQYESTIELRRPDEGLIQTYGAYAGDINNDNFSDLVVVNETSDDLRILLNDGTGHYGDFVVYPMGNLSPSPNEGGDFNNDGEIDFAVSTAHQDEVRVMFGDGQGNFSPMETYHTDMGVRGLVVLDCNGDAHDDIFVTNRIAGNLSLLTNDGTGNFTVSGFNSDGEGESAVSVADANHDGIPDLFIGMYTSQEIVIFLGDGEGFFNISDRTAVPGNPWMLGTGDFNNDGHPDVVSANSLGNATVVCFGDGMGGLSAPDVYTVPGVQFPLAIDVGDIDGDGDLDFVSSNYNSTNYVVFENDGAGNFSAADILTAPNHASCAILHDRDNDGDLDISGTDEGDDIIILFENPGPVAIQDPALRQIKMQLSPNPAAKKFNLAFELEASELVEISLYDREGRLVQQLFSGKLPAGSQQMYWELKTLPQGVYHCRLQGESFFGVEKLVVGK